VTMTDQQLLAHVREWVRDNEEFRATLSMIIWANTDLKPSADRMATLVDGIGVDVLEYLIRSGWRQIPPELMARSISTWQLARLAGEDVAAHVSAGDPPNFADDGRFKAIEAGCIRLGEILHELTRLNVTPITQASAHCPCGNDGTGMHPAQETMPLHIFRDGWVIPVVLDSTVPRGTCYLRPTQED